MAINVGDAVLKIRGDEKPLNQSLDRAQQKTKSAMQKMQSAARGVGIAFTAIGIAGLKMVDSARKMNAQLGVTALNLSITRKEMRNLALETTNVTFPLKEVIASFDLLARAGVKDTETLKKVATAFDTLGDATGYTASQVTEFMVPAMKTFGLSAEEMAKKTDLMTYMSRESTMTMEDFNTMVGYTTPELVAAGLTMEDLTAALIHMEKQGYAPGRVMTREFMKATTLAAKENISLTEALGMTAEELAGYKEQLEGATGMTQEYADEANKQYGLMDKVKQKFEELTLKAGSFLEPLEPILAAMTALGPMMILLSTSAGIAAVKWMAHTAAMIAHKVALIASIVAIKLATVAQWLWNAALTANPIGIVIMAIAGLVAAGIALWKNWDKVVAFFKKAWRNIKLFFLQGIEKILGSLAKFTSWIPWLGEKVQKAHDAIANMIDAEKVERDVAKVNKALRDNEVALKDNWEAVQITKEAIDPGLTEALANERKELEATQQALEEQKATLETQAEEVDKLSNAYKGLGEATKAVTLGMKEISYGVPGMAPAQVPVIGPAAKPYWYAQASDAMKRVIQGGWMTEAAMARDLAIFERIVTGTTALPHGGIAMRPIVASIAEKQPEAVIPLSREALERVGLGGYRTMNLIVEMDGQPILRMVEEKMVDDIRLKTGVRI